MPRFVFQGLSGSANERKDSCSAYTWQWNHVKSRLGCQADKPGDERISNNCFELFSPGPSGTFDPSIVAHSE